jgi:hypothetical protein
MLPSDSWQRWAMLQEEFLNFFLFVLNGRWFSGGGYIDKRSLIIGVFLIGIIKIVTLFKLTKYFFLVDFIGNFKGLVRLRIV